MLIGIQFDIQSLFLCCPRLCRQQFEALMTALAALIAFDAAVKHRMLPDDKLMKDEAIAPTLRGLFENK